MAAPSKMMMMGLLNWAREQGEGIGLAFRFKEVGAIEGQALFGLRRTQPRKRWSSGG